jgi:hypothetical protein
MKKLILLPALFIVFGALGQTRTGAYNRIVIDIWQPKTDQSTAVTKWRNGTIKVTKKLILIDSSVNYRQVYSIVNRSEISDFCYDDGPKAGIQFFTAILMTPNGFKTLKGYFMYAKDKKTLTDVVFKPAKDHEITYTFNTD